MTVTLDRRAALALGAVALAGCALRHDRDALTLWAISYEGDYSPLLMPAFTRATGIAVEVQSLPWSAAHEKLLTAFAGGSLPDVFMLPNDWVREFAMIGALARVPDPVLVDAVFPAVRAAVALPDGDVAVPWSAGPQVQFYRRDILAAAGYDRPAENWAEWRRMGLALKRRRPNDYLALMYLNWPDMLFAFASQVGAPMLRDEATRGHFAEPRFAEALGYYASLFQLGLAPRALSTEIQDPIAAFAQGYFAIFPNNATLLLDLRRRSAEIGADRWSTARLPGPAGPAPGPVGGNSLCVAASSRRPSDAWALVRHMTSTPSELYMQRAIGMLPARATAWATPQLSGPVIAPFATQMAAPAPQPTVIEWGRIRNDVQLIAERVARGLDTVSAGLAAMDARADAILATRRRLLSAGGHA